MQRDDWDFQNHFVPTDLVPAFRMEGWWCWCGSVIRGMDGTYHMFASRWPKYLPFHPGWGVASEIVRAESDRLEGPYEFKEIVLGARGAGWWDGRSSHNPAIQKCGDEYLLFYTGMTYPFPDITAEDHLDNFSPQWLAARASKRIGLATSKSIYGPWKRQDKPLLDVRPGYFDDFFTSNPAPCVNEDGSCLLVYKARSYATPPYRDKAMEMFSTMKLGVAYADHYSRPFVRLRNTPIFSLEDGVLEDPFIWKTGDGYRMIAKDWGGTYTKEKGDGIFAASLDGMDWKIKEGATAFTHDIPLSDGGSRHLGNMDRPWIYFEGNRMKALFVATNDGYGDSFGTLTESWNACIPLD
jgi:hypothetical protein